MISLTWYNLTKSTMKSVYRELHDSVKKAEEQIYANNNKLLDELNIETMAMQPLLDLEKYLNILYEDVKNNPDGSLNPDYAPPKVKEALEKLGEFFDSGMLDQEVAPGVTNRDILYRGLSQEEKEQLNDNFKKMDKELRLEKKTADPNLVYAEKKVEEQQVNYNATANEYYDWNKNALQNIDDVRKKLNKLTAEEDAHSYVRREMVASIFALRSSVNSVRNDKSSLVKEVDGDKYLKTFNKLMNDAYFKEYVDSLPLAEIKKAMKKGNGGLLEDGYRKAVSQIEKMPDNVDDRYAPTYGDRARFLQGRLTGISAENPNRDRYAAEFMLCQPTAGANAKEHLKEKIPSVSQFNEGAADRQKLMTPETVDQIVGGLSAAKKDAGQETALQHITELKKEILADTWASQTPERKEEVLTEILATRIAVNSTPGDKSTLKVPIDPVKLQQAREMVKGSVAVKTALGSLTTEQVQKAMKKGNGGIIENLVRENADQYDFGGRYDPNIPTRLMKFPNYVESTKELHKMIKEEQRTMNDDRVKRYFAQSIYLANAERHNIPVTPERFRQNVNHLMQSKALDNLIKTNAPDGNYNDLLSSLPARKGEGRMIAGAFERECQKTGEAEFAGEKKEAVKEEAMQI